MGFFFSSPLFLWGLAGSLIPLVLHLERRRSARTVPFTMLRFLREVERRRFLNLRILEYLLLFLRMMVLALIALALAGPTVTFPKGAPRWMLFLTSRSEHRDTVILFDTSASMGAAGVSGSPWDEAVRVLEATARRPRLRPMLSVYPFSDGLDRPAPTLPPAPLPPDLERGLRELAPTGERTDVAKAVGQLRKQVGSLEGRELVVVTDLQRCGWDSVLRGTATLPANVRLTVVDVSEQTPINLWLEGLETPWLPWGYGQEEVVRFLVRNCGLDPGTSVSAEVTLLAAGGELAQKQTVTLNPGVSLLLEWGLLVSAEDRFQGRLRLQPAETVVDALPADNRVDFEVPVLSGKKALLVGAEEPLGRAALSIAFSPPAEGEGDRYFMSVSHAPSLGELPPDLEEYALVALVPGPGTPFKEETVIPLDGFVGDGGGLLLAPGRLAPASEPARFDGADALEGTFANFGFPVERVGTAEEPISITRVEEDHPIFASLPDLPRSALGSVHLRRWLELGGDASVLAAGATQNGNEEIPMLLERPFGSGKILVLATGLDAESSDLAVSSLMVPLFDAIAKYLSARAQDPAVAGGLPARPESDLTRLSGEDLAALGDRADVRFLRSSALPEGIPSRALGGSLTALFLWLALVAALVELWLSNTSL